MTPAGSGAEGLAPVLWDRSLGSLGQGDSDLEFESPIKEVVGAGLWVGWFACERHALQTSSRWPAEIS